MTMPSQAQLQMQNSVMGCEMFLSSEPQTLDEERYLQLHRCCIFDGRHIAILHDASGV